MAFAVPGDCFEREYGCSETEWRSWMPAAVHGHGLHDAGERAYRVDIGAGRLQLAWQVLPPRVIALVTLPRLQVRFCFEGVEAAQRDRFMRAFDLRTQRGGG